MDSTQFVYRAYKKARRKFAMKVYILFFVWLLLALAQWLIIVFVDAAADIFYKYYYICAATFILAIILLAVFIFVEKLRFKKAVALIFAFIIVELQVISLFCLIARIKLLYMIIGFVCCVLLICFFLIVGAFLPRKLDFTLHVAVIFIFAFLMLLMAVFFLMCHLLIYEIFTYAFCLVQFPISLAVLLFVMYHAQTIHGGRFAEMRLHDFVLASVILFHDFLIIYWLTFYWSPSMEGSTTTNETSSTVAMKRLSTARNARVHDLMDDMYDPPNIRNGIIYPYDNEKKHQTTTIETTEQVTEPALTLDFMNDDLLHRKTTRSKEKKRWKGEFRVRKTEYARKLRSRVNHRTAQSKVITENQFEEWQDTTVVTTISPQNSLDYP
ncbi:uncharacterized protein LOC108599167 [Drosophila busckii]|uniref:uncharacterized protein LOC108599167 n=1 Tax=Drosophila busckii TaxID=30019 RepID=UPI001433420D|nr:uncharacterized protein LOC108599167 [Drosophila busckii]